MRNKAEPAGFGTTLPGAVALTLTLALTVGCGGDAEPNPPPNNGGTDAGMDPVPDAGVPPPADTAFAAVRFNTNGTLDTSFGSGGVALVDVGPAAASGARETLWGMASDSTDRLVLFGHSKGADRIDVDRVVVRLTKNGAVDTAFGTNGVSTLNIGNLADNGRHGLVQPDGKIVSSGYTPQPTGVGTQTGNRLVLARFNDDGKLDTTFGAKGVVNSMPIQPADPVNTEWGYAEAYGVGYQSGKYVTTGYGRSAASGGVDLLSFRYTSTGQLDTTWGTNGVFTLDLVGDNERGRNMVILPDDRVFMVGSGTPAAQNVDAMAVMLTANGAPDTSFSPDGYKLYGFGRPEEAFFGAAVSPSGDRLAAAGYQAGGNQDDDGLLLLQSTSGGTAFVQPTPISETENDRFFAVAFDSAGKAYAAGFLAEAGDNRMIVARFNPDGALDTSFGTGGVAAHNVIQAGTDEMARAVVIQSDGKVVVAGTVEKK